MNSPEASAQITFALSRLSLFFRSESWQSARAQGLTPTQVDILSLLDRRGPTRGAHLAHHLGVKAATLSDSAAALVAKGLVDSTADPADARAKRFELTPAGAETLAHLPQTPPALDQVLDALRGSDRAALLRALTRLIRGLQEARAIPVQRMCATCAHFRPFAHKNGDALHHCAFIDAAFGEDKLRIDCGEHEKATDEERDRMWSRFNAVA